MLYAIRTGNQYLDRLIKGEVYTEDDIERIVEITKEQRGLEKARRLAEKYTEKAFNQIDKLPEHENKYIFRHIANKLLIREY